MYSKEVGVGVGEETEKEEEERNESGMVVYACNTSTKKVEAGGSRDQTHH